MRYYVLAIPSRRLFQWVDANSTDEAAAKALANPNDWTESTLHGTQFDITVTEHPVHPNEIFPNVRAVPCSTEEEDLAKIEAERQELDETAAPETMGDTERWRKRARALLSEAFDGGIGSATSLLTAGTNMGPLFDAMAGHIGTELQLVYGRGYEAAIKQAVKNGWVKPRV